MISNRIQNIQESGSVALASKVIELKKAGQDIISLSIGEPDFDTPVEIIEATKKALDQQHTRYSLVPGILELREAICQKLLKENHIKAKPEEVLIANGSKQILYNIFQAILNPEDEVIVPTPYWVTFPESIKLAGGQPVFVDCPHLQLDLELIEKAITPKTRAIIINSPNNPSGAVYPPEVIEKLAHLAVKKDLWLISDEAYEYFTYTDKKHLSAASLSAEIFNKTITVQTFSKSFCMTGFRIGYMVAPKHLIQAVNKLQSHLTGNNCTFAQYGALEALTMDQSFFHQMKETFKKRRDLAYELCKEIMDCPPPEGAFYLFPNVESFLPHRFQDDAQMALHILTEARVAILPGSFFGMPGHLRFSFSNSEENIKEAFRRIKEVL